MTGWPQCPYQADDGGGRCALPDFSGSHTTGAGVSRHLCWDGQYTRGRSRSGAVRTPYRAYATSRRDAGRWTHQEAGQPPCPRWSSRAGVPCRLLDVPELHGAGHDALSPAGGTVGWSTDAEDVVRWRATTAAGRSFELAGWTGLPPADPELPRPEGWDPDPGDYAFAYKNVSATSSMSARALAGEQIAAAQLVVHEGPVTVPYADGWLMWFRTGPRGPAKEERR